MVEVRGCGARLVSIWRWIDASAVCLRSSVAFYSFAPSSTNSLSYGRAFYFHPIPSSCHITLLSLFFFFFLCIFTRCFFSVVSLVFLQVQRTIPVTLSVWRVDISSLRRGDSYLSAPYPTTTATRASTFSARCLTHLFVYYSLSSRLVSDLPNSFSRTYSSCPRKMAAIFLLEPVWNGTWFSVQSVQSVSHLSPTHSTWK